MAPPRKEDTPLREKWRRARRTAYRKNPRKTYDDNLRNRLRRVYGLTPEELEAMKQERDGRCDICGEQKRLYVDHDHETGEVRGLLCNRCNTGLRVLEEPERLAASQEYLRRRAHGGSRAEAGSPDAGDREGCQPLEGEAVGAEHPSPGR